MGWLVGKSSWRHLPGAQSGPASLVTWALATGRFPWASCGYDPIFRLMATYPWADYQWRPRWSLGRWLPNGFRGRAAAVTPLSVWWPPTLGLTISGLVRWRSDGLRGRAAARTPFSVGWPPNLALGRQIGAGQRPPKIAFGLPEEGVSHTGCRLHGRPCGWGAVRSASLSFWANH